MKARLLGVVLIGAVTLFGTPRPCIAAESFDGTVERFAHGFLEVRAFDDCKLHSLVMPHNATREEWRALFNEIQFILERRQNAHVVGANGEIVSITPTTRTGDAAKKCITNLGTSHVDGRITDWGQGNNGAGFDLRVADGHTVNFNWVYAYGNPKVNPRVGLNCGDLRTTCRPKHPHVRVTYKTQVTGDGTALVPLSVDPI